MFFFHAFESITPVAHEIYTQRVILEDTEIHKILLQVSDDFPEKVASIINYTHPNELLNQIISGQLDADRMDYLLRDAYFTGTSYGKFDLERILRTMRVRDNQIVFKESGAQAIENYILARYHMYWQVYYHAVSRSYEQLLSTIFLRIRDLYEQNYDFEVDIRYLCPFLE